MFKKLLAFFVAISTLLSGGAVSVIGSTDMDPIVATERAHVYDADRLLLGAYCFPKRERNYTTLRKWFKQAGLDFYIGAWGDQLTADDLAWLEENGLGVFAPNTAYYHDMESDAIWGIDYRDEPNAKDFDALAAGVAAEYAANPDRLPLVNLFPMYASGEQLGEFADVPGARGDSPADSFNTDSIQYRMHVSDYIGKFDSDVISVDIYPLEVDRETGKKGTYRYWLRNLDILAESCRKTNRDLWVVTQAAGNTVEEEGGKRHCDTVEDQRWQNYVSLAFGAKAIIYACYYTGWWDGASHMIDNAGNRTVTYYAVQRANRELAPFAKLYGNYENHGAVLYNRMNPNAAGAKLPLTKVVSQYQPDVITAAPVLCGCFTEKAGDGTAFVFTNMYEPETGKSAAFTAAFPGAKSMTLYRMGKVTTIPGSRLSLTLANEEGVFVTVNNG